MNANNTQQSQNEFKVPAGYFDSLEQDLLQIPERSKKPFTALKIAASIALIATVVVSAFYFNQQNPSLVNTSIDQELMQLEWYQLAEELPDNDAISFTSIPDEDIIDYLSNENIELSEIESIF